MQVSWQHAKCQSIIYCKRNDERNLPSLISERLQIPQILLQIFQFFVENGHVVMKDLRAEAV